MLVDRPISLNPIVPAENFDYSDQIVASSLLLREFLRFDFFYSDLFELILVLHRVQNSCRLWETEG